ncbi:MAG: DUF1559 domain-containing protein [Thermoguttaceae bacterium]
MLLTALCLNRSEKLRSGVEYAFFLFFFGIICSWLLLANSSAREAARNAGCIHKLKAFGFALQCYHDANKHFPLVNICDKNGKPLFSWRVQILPMMEYGSIYGSLKIDEPWNSPHNAKVLSQVLLEYQCPSAHREKNDCFTNYIAIIGAGTAWREDGPVKLSDLPDRGSHTIMAVEVVNSGVHWAEPRDLTVEEALEGLKTGKGLRISTAHPSVINVLFANDMFQSLPTKMPISLWQKLLAGEVKDVNNIEEMIDPSAPDMVNVSVLPSEPGKWAIILSIIVWLLSVALLFRRAIKSRRKLLSS